ncbi:unnamed protein product, partial [Polarella glacialis]
MEYPGMFPSAATIISSNGPYKEEATCSEHCDPDVLMSEIYKIPNTPDVVKAIFKRYEPFFNIETFDPRRRLRSAPPAVVCGLFGRSTATDRGAAKRAHQKFATWKRCSLRFHRSARFPQAMLQDSLCGVRTPYLRCMARLLHPAQRSPGVLAKPRRILVLGLGGGLLPAALCAAGDEVVVVERSAVVIRLAQEFFGLPSGVCYRAGEADLRFQASELPPSLQIQEADAEGFVLRLAEDLAGSSPDNQGVRQEPFDACAIDIFQGHSFQLPDFVRSARFHLALRSLLKPGGLVVQNALSHCGEVLPALRESRYRIPRPALPEGSMRCYAWRRDAAPLGPLLPATFPRQNEAADQLAELRASFMEAYAGVTVRRPCSWVP